MWPDPLKSAAFNVLAMLLHLSWLLRHDIPYVGFAVKVPPYRPIISVR
jgi:hypothetical protein